jgi:hypothetical protein
MHVLSAAMNTVVHRRILSPPRSYTRLYSTNNTPDESPAPPSQRVTPRRYPPYPPTEPQTRRHEAPETPPQSSPYPPWITWPRTQWQRPEDSATRLNQRSPPRPSTQSQARHEAHEGTTALNVPFNPPGGGSGGNIPGGGGGASFAFTKNPILDAILTTALGLGAGNSICITHLSLPAQVP